MLGRCRTTGWMSGNGSVGVVRNVEWARWRRSEGRDWWRHHVTGRPRRIAASLVSCRVTGRLRVQAMIRLRCQAERVTSCPVTDRPWHGTTRNYRRKCSKSWTWPWRCHAPPSSRKSQHWCGLAGLFLRQVGQKSRLVTGHPRCPSDGNQKRKCGGFGTQCHAPACPFEA